MLATSPAPIDFVRKRLGALLARYPLADVEDDMRLAMAADDVAAVLGANLPAWAIAEAVTAWLSSPRGRFRPAPGELIELARVAMGWAIEAQSRLFMEDHPNSISWHPMAKRLAPVEVAISDEERARNLAKLDALLGGDAWRKETAHA